MPRRRSGLSPWRVVHGAWKEIHRDNPTFMAGALSYFTLFSFVPGVMILIAVAGRVFETSAVKDTVLAYVSAAFDPGVANAVQVLLSAMDKSFGQVTLVSGLILLWAATRAFGHLQTAFNQIWKVTPSRSGLHQALFNRLRSVLLVAIVGGLLSALMLADVGWVLIKRWANPFTPTVLVHWVMPVVGQLVALGSFAVFFALLFKMVPQTRVAWRDVRFGALVSAALYTLSRFALASYFRWMHLESLLGASGSVIVLLIWIYFSMLILLFGAKICCIVAHHRGDDPPLPARRFA